MSPDEAVKVVARHLIANAAVSYLDDGWGMYPEVGFYDWEEITEQVKQFAVYPDDEQYNEAYVLLTSRADDRGGAA